MGDRLWVGKSSRYVTGHLGQLSLPSLRAYATSTSILVRRGNLGPILHRFRDIAGFVLVTTPQFHINFGGVFVVLIGTDHPFWDQCEQVP